MVGFTLCCQGRCRVSVKPRAGWLRTEWETRTREGAERGPLVGVGDRGARASCSFIRVALFSPIELDSALQESLETRSADRKSLARESRKVLSLRRLAPTLDFPRARYSLLYLYTDYHLLLAPHLASASNSLLKQL